jgi:hypothetical protein
MSQPRQDPEARQSEGTFEGSKPSQSLGRWIDNLLGDKKARARAAAKAEERNEAIPED